MIPKIIHYCWFGRNPLPESALKCIASWKKFLPDCEIKEWNENNFDVNIIPYTAEAYEQKKYAFVSDYARFWILYKYGGIYFDTDVEVIRPMDDIISKDSFMGCETDFGDNTHIEVNPGLGLGVSPGVELLKKVMTYYKSLHFIHESMMSNQITVVHITTKILMDNGLSNTSGIQNVGGVWVYPSEYFCPVNVTTGRMHVTENTRTIHHYEASWADKKFSLKNWFKRLLPENVVLRIIQIKSRVKHS